MFLHVEKIVHVAMVLSVSRQGFIHSFIHSFIKTVNTVDKPQLNT